MIGYLGPEGSFTHQALSVYISKLKQKDSILPFQTISQIIDSVSMGKVSSGIVPMENSIQGSVWETLDQLIKTSQKVTINSEVITSAPFFSKLNRRGKFPKLCSLVKPSKFQA